MRSIERKRVYPTEALHGNYITINHRRTFSDLKLPISILIIADSHIASSLNGTLMSRYSL